MKKDSNTDAVTKILALSYHDLPYYLKQCFLYFGIYPEDYEVKTKRLFRQWVAEGFVKQEGTKTLEEVAKEYLTELVNRSLVQVSSLTIDGKIRSCRVHDLLHDMILGKSKDLSFCHFIINKDGEPDLMGSTESMRSIESSDVRSVFVFKRGDLPEGFARILLTKYKPFKVLDFQDALLCTESSVDDLMRSTEAFFIHLKYLSLRLAYPVSLANLPKSIGKLKNLQTLDVRRTRLHELPREISKLKKLRHLLLSKSTSLIHLKDCIGLMTSLQTLKEVNADGVGAELIRELGKLRQLRELRITSVRTTEQVSALCSSINEMQHLEILHINRAADVSGLHLISSPPRKLRKLHLNGKLSKVPEWIPELQNLVKLSLESSSLTDDPMKSLQNVPNLLFLSLRFFAYNGESLHFQEGGFKKLKELCLGNLIDLNSIFIDKGALPSLKMFKLEEIADLKTVPSGIQHLQKLEVLDIYRMPTEFIQSTRSSSICPLSKFIPSLEKDPKPTLFRTEGVENIKAYYF